MGIYDHSFRSTFVRSHKEHHRKAWLSVSALMRSKGVLLGLGEDSVQGSHVHPHQILSSMSLWALHVMLEQEGTSPNCSHKVGSMALSNISWYAEAFRVPFTGTFSS